MSWIDYVVKPIEIWPGARTPAFNRRRAPFKGSWSRTMSELTREIQALYGDSVVIRVDVAQKHLRLDGQLRADARPKDPGVLLEFTARKLNGEPRLVYRCDTYSHWEDNLLAIALGLEALRKVERYGVTPAGEQYAGFKALPSATDSAVTLSPTAAAEIIASYSNESAFNILKSVESYRTAIRSAVNRTHPDKNNGRRTDFDRMTAARTVLSLHHGIEV